MRFILPALLLLLAFSCASTETKKTIVDSAAPVEVSKPEFKKGELTTLTVSADPSNSFTVYLPADFDSTKKYPLVVFFDPHADGSLPLNKYKSLAEKWGFIFAGSNTSKNGMAPEQADRVFNGLIDELKRILTVDQQQLIVCGFSGGARVASGGAILRKDIKGIICNSASSNATNSTAIFIGLAGLGDMNYLEMKTNESNSSRSKIPHELLVFNGKHEWAPVNMMEDALLMISIIPGNSVANENANEMYRALGISIIDQADSIKKTSCMIADNLLQSGMRAQNAAAKGNTRIITGDDYRINVGKSSTCVTADKAAWKAAEDEENQLQQELASALLSQDTTWWKINSASYFKSKKQGADKFMHERLQGYASLMCYSYANQAFRTNNLHAAEKFVAIYSIVDPENSEWAYMRANLYMQINLNDYALSALEKAASLGFKDKARLQNDPVFAPIRSDERFAALIGKMN
ncbi:hypothetical protein BH11BAC7_BH11BAC7_05970 [soil metagenome]